jgi:hypothetical protein
MFFASVFFFAHCEWRSKVRKKSVDDRGVHRYAFTYQKKIGVGQPRWIHGTLRNTLCRVIIKCIKRSRVLLWGESRSKSSQLSRVESSRHAVCFLEYPRLKLFFYIVFISFIIIYRVFFFFANFKRMEWHNKQCSEHGCILWFLFYNINYIYYWLVGRNIISIPVQWFAHQAAAVQYKFSRSRQTIALLVVVLVVDVVVVVVVVWLSGIESPRWLHQSADDAPEICHSVQSHTK